MSIAVIYLIKKWNLVSLLLYCCKWYIHNLSNKFNVKVIKDICKRKMHTKILQHLYLLIFLFIIYNLKIKYNSTKAINRNIKLE